MQIGILPVFVSTTPACFSRHAFVFAVHRQIMGIPLPVGYKPVMYFITQLATIFSGLSGQHTHYINLAYSNLQ